MTTTFPRTAHWQPKLNSDGFAEDIADLQQCVQIILETPKGSVPLRPDFGSNVHLYIDWPIDRARPHIVRETVGAVRKWEKRLEVTRVEVLPDGEHTIIRPYFKLADGVERSLEARL